MAARPGRKREDAAVAAALRCKTLKDWPLDWQLLPELTVAAALFLVAVAGLLLRPVRAYTGLVRRCPGALAQWGFQGPDRMETLMMTGPLPAGAASHWRPL
jgi:hypothetical protein